MKTIIYLILAFSSNCISANCFLSPEGPPYDAVATSFLSLLAAPNKYVDKPVEVNGFLYKDGDLVRLFFDERSLKYYLLQESLILEVTESSVSVLPALNNKYVSAIGFFKNSVNKNIVGQLKGLSFLCKASTLVELEDSVSQAKNYLDQRRSAQKK